MSPDTTPRVHGVPQPKGQTWLNEVRVDAARAAIQHLEQQKEREDFKRAKAEGITPQEILQRGKESLGLVDAEPAPEPNVPEPKQSAVGPTAKDENKKESK